MPGVRFWGDSGKIRDQQNDFRDALAALAFSSATIVLFSEEFLNSFAILCV